MPRSTWKGYLKLSLVSCAVTLYNATSSAEWVTFNTLHRKTSNRLKQQMVDSGTGQPVDPADRVKGYQIAKNQYVLVEDDDLDDLKIESSKIIEIETFVPVAEVDQTYFDGSYYLAPDDAAAEEAFAVIREAMARKGMVGIGRVVLSRRERLIMLQPRGKGVVATTLRYAYEVRSDAEYFAGINDVQVPEGLLDIAELIISRKSGHFAPETFNDRYEEAVVQMLKAKQAGESLAVAEAPWPNRIVDLMDALRQSLEAAGGKAAPVRRPKAPSKKTEETTPAEPARKSPKKAD
jgi:DNA end-binding protein Ku